MKRATFGLAFLVVTVAQAQEVNISYEDWQRLSAMTRAAYLAGIIDTLYAYPEDETTYRWGKCIGRKKKTLVELSDDMVAVRSKTAPRTVQEAFRQYQHILCPDVF
jgi:hypothetical protein